MVRADRSLVDRDGAPVVRERSFRLPEVVQLRAARVERGGDQKIIRAEGLFAELARALGSRERFGIAAATVVDRGERDLELGSKPDLLGQAREDGRRDRADPRRFVVLRLLLREIEGELDERARLVAI